MRKFKDLKVWQKSIELATQVYLQTKTFPIEEKFNFAVQINKSIVSIASKIAQGEGRNHEKEFSNFLELQLVLPLN
jgi:four helix bundle protein